MESVFVIIPAYNEGRVLASTVWSLLGHGYSIVVVDDGSTDGCGEQLRGMNVHYLRHAINLGQGAALETGVEYALANGAQYIVHFDADGQHPKEAIEGFLEPLRRNECDIVTGSRFLDPRDQLLIPPARRLLLRLAVIVSGFLTHSWLTDAHNGFRVMTAQAARRIPMKENGFAHATELIDLVHRSGLRLKEMPVSIQYTEHSIAKGQSGLNSLNILIEALLRKML
jgi:glycosyltransferase involved in cell wall biosynthesis